MIHLRLIPKYDQGAREIDRHTKRQKERERELFGKAQRRPKASPNKS
jgi:hypothetical protein